MCLNYGDCDFSRAVGLCVRKNCVFYLHLGRAASILGSHERYAGGFVAAADANRDVRVDCALWGCMVKLVGTR